jgi:hypothetical protein
MAALLRACALVLLCNSTRCTQLELRATSMARYPLATTSKRATTRSVTHGPSASRFLGASGSHTTQLMPILPKLLRFTSRRKKGGFANGDNSWSSYLQDYTPLPKQGVDVFVSGTENYPTFRNPAILDPCNGQRRLLLVFAEGRHGVTGGITTGMT